MFLSVRDKQIIFDLYTGTSLYRQVLGELRKTAEKSGDKEAEGKVKLQQAKAVQAEIAGKALVEKMQRNQKVKQRKRKRGSGGLLHNKKRGGRE